MDREHSPRNRTRQGRFAPNDNPPRRKVLVALSEPFITALDAYGKENGTGRGGSIENLLQDTLGVSYERPKLPPAEKDMVDLIPVKRSNPLYIKYIENRGTTGQ